MIQVYNMSGALTFRPEMHGWSSLTRTHLQKISTMVTMIVNLGGILLDRVQSTLKASAKLFRIFQSNTDPNQIEWNIKRRSLIEMLAYMT